VCEVGCQQCRTLSHFFGRAPKSVSDLWWQPAEVVFKLFVGGIGEAIGRGLPCRAYRCTPSRDGPRTTSYVGARRVLS